MRKLNVIISLLITHLLYTGPLNAEIYKCTKDNKTTYSEEPCEGTIEKIKVNPGEKTGMSLTNDSMDNVSNELSSERNVRDLERAIASQEKRLDKIERNYQKDMNKLGEKKARLKAKKKTQDDKKKYRLLQNKASIISPATLNKKQANKAFY